MTVVTTTAPSWSVVAISRLRDATSCPVCGQAALDGSRCRSCGADLTTPAAVDLWEASQTAAAALSAREELRLSIPRSAPAAAVAPPASRQPTSPPGALRPAASPPRGDTPVQAVLAVAGAGLFAVAAIVFTFFNPDLTDHGLRSIVTLAVTLVFLVGARMLGARGLRSSAETVGALGMLFVALDVYAAAALAPSGVSAWVFAAIGTLVAGTAMAVLAVRLRLRAWIGASAVGLALVPAMLGAAGDSQARLLGWLTTMAAGLALLVVLRRVAAAFTARLAGEAVALTLVQVLAVGGVLLHVVISAEGSADRLLWTAAGVLACLSLLGRLSARLIAGPMWSFAAGAGTAAAVTAAAFGLIETLDGAPLWYPIAMMTAPVCGFLLVSLVLSHPAGQRPWAHAGALLVTGFAALPVLGMALASALSTVAAAWSGTDPGAAGEGAGLAIGLAAAALGFAGHAAVLRRRGTVAPWSAVVSAWTAAATAATTTSLPYPPTAPWPALPWPGVAVGVVIAGAVAAVLTRRRALRPAVGVPMHVGAYVSLLLAVALSWSTTGLAVASAPAALGALAALAFAAPARVRWIHMGVGYAYALVVAGAGLGLTGLGEIAVLSLVTSAGALVAIVTTFVPSVRVPTWWTILAVTSIPFFLGVLQVLLERSGWTALSTGLIFLLALTLVLTRRPGLVPVLRALCAGMLVPSLAVVVVCLGAQVLAVSASPITLPVIAVIVAVALPAATTAAAMLERRGMATATASLVRRAIELSALVTGALAVCLALIRDAAGLPTAIAVLVILAVGAGTAAVLTRRVLFWWTAAVSVTGALWSVWRLAEIDVLEPYVLPPALAAVVVGVILAARGHGGHVLAAVGLAVAVMPSLVVFAVAGGTWRLLGLLATAVLLWLAARVSTKWQRPGLARLRVPALLVAVVAAAAGPLQGARVGWGLDSAAPDIAPFPALAMAATGAFLAALAGHAIARVAPHTRAARSRWLLAPAALYLFGGTWAAIERDWTVIWAMWSLMIVALCILVAVAWRLRARAGILPPLWFLFALAFVTAIVAWSPRDLRVEWFSLPLGAALLIAGWMHLHHRAQDDGQDATPSWESWPRGWSGSWALLAPGLVTIMSASIVATFTDPLTWRAILVIVMALIAILVGARARLAAPFLIGVIVLPIENVSAFAVQIGRGIESMPWWITLAVVGAVLLILAVSYERRAGEAEGIAARLRDLR